MGYLRLCEALVADPERHSGPWNFGPAESECWPVGTLATTIAELWGQQAIVRVEQTSEIFEHSLLALDSSKAAEHLDWNPRWSVAEGLARTVEWHKAMDRGEDMWAVTRNQLRSHAQIFSGIEQ